MAMETQGSAKGLSRREVLALAGAAGVAGAVGGLPAGADARAPRATSGGQHPLEPLTPHEITRCFALIEGDSRFPSGAAFPIITLLEPPKAEVLAWSAGRAFRREAFANVYDPASNALFEVIVDLRAGHVTSWRELPACSRRSTTASTPWQTRWCGRICAGRTRCVPGG